MVYTTKFSSLEKNLLQCIIVRRAARSTAADSSTFYLCTFSFNHHMYGTRRRARACMGHGMRLSVLKAKNAWPPRVVTRGPASIFECTQGVLNLIQI